MASMLQRIAAAAACALLLAFPASAQLIGPGHVMGNGTASPAAPTDTALSAIMNQTGSGMAAGVAGFLGASPNTNGGMATLGAAPVNGQCAVWNSSGKLASIACTPAGSGTVGAGSQGQIAAYTGAGSTTSVVGIPATCTPAEAVGFVGNNSTANDTAYSNWKTSVGTADACLAFSSGVYVFNSTPAGWTLACGQHVFFRGSASRGSVLRFTVAGSGLSFTYGTSCGYANNSVASGDSLGFATDVANSGGSAILINGHSAAGTPMVQTSWTNIFVGNLGGAVAGTAYWVAGLNFSDVANVYVANLTWRGCTACKLGTPINYSGSSSSTFPTQMYVTNLDAVFAATCVSAVGWVQGVVLNVPVCTAANFGFVANGSGQEQNEFNSIGGQFDVYTNCFNFTNTTTNSITGVQCATNRATSPGSTAAIVLVGSSYTTVAGNTFVGNFASAPAQNAILCLTGTFGACANNMINNNIFQGYNINIVVDATSAGNYITYNRSGNGTPVSLGGSSANTCIGNGGVC